MPITPFGFDRVFRFPSVEPPRPKEEDDDLRERYAALESLHARQKDEYQAELARARLDGFDAGLTQARAERAEATLAATDALHAALDEVDRKIADITQRMMREAAEVAFSAAELMAGHALAAEPGRAIDEALGRVLHQVARGTALQIRVHPDTVPDMEALVAQRVAGERRALSLTVIPDEKLAANDAHIVWAEGGLFVDAAARRAAVQAEMAGLLEAPREA